MNPIAELVPRWAADRSRKLMLDARKARDAYTRPEITAWTWRYADAMQECSEIMRKLAEEMQAEQQRGGGK